MKHPTDSAGRRIREGDRVDGPTRDSGIVLGARFGAVDVTSKYYNTRAYSRPEDLTITHRSGEPIEEISPMVRDANGRVIERGVRVSTQDGRAWTVDFVQREGKDWTAMLYRPGSGSTLLPAKHLTVIPDRASTTLTVHHDPDTDPAQLLRDAGMEVES